MNHGKKALGKIMTIEPGLFLGLNYLLLHSDRHRPAIQEHDQQEVAYQRSLWNGLCPASPVTQSSFYLWRPKEVSAKNPHYPPSSHGSPCGILSRFPRGSLRRPFPAIIPPFLLSHSWAIRGSEPQEQNLEPWRTAPFLPALRTPSGSEPASDFNMRKLQSRDDVLLTKATPPMRTHVGRGNDHLAPTICFSFSTLLSSLNWTR